MIARWTARIFPDNKSNPVVDEHFVITDRGVVIVRDVVARGVVLVSEHRHGVSVVAVSDVISTVRAPSGVA